MKNSQPASPRQIRSLMAAVCAVSLLALPAGIVSAQQSRGGFTVVETGQTFTSLQQAVMAIGQARGTIAIAPGTYRECAVQEAGVMSYLATDPGSVVFDGVACEGKAALVLRGQGAEVSGLIFQNMAVPDFNGAGIRLEQGNLTVAQSWFRNSQQGILTASDPNSRIVIDKSTFTGLGTCEGSGGCAHSIYIGDYGLLRVTRSRFEAGGGGHYVKSRAARVEIAASSFDDSHGQQTNYMIDLPNGATGQISNNWFVQGQSKENHSAMITVAPEGKNNPSDGLTIAGNDARYAPNANRNCTFVVDWSGDNITMGDNKLASGLKSFDRY